MALVSPENFSSEGVSGRHKPGPKTLRITYLYVIVIVFE